MFVELANQVWTPEDATVTVSTNTDFSIDGSSRKVIWSDGINKKVTVTFTAVTMSDYEELCFYIYQRPSLMPGDLFEIAIDGQTFAFESMKGRDWRHIIIDCADMGSVSSFTITSLVDDLWVFIDTLGVRYVDHTRDLDLLTAFKDKIELDYDVDTTLAANVTAAGLNITLSSYQYVNNTSVLLLDDGAGHTAQVQLATKNTLKAAAGRAFASGSAVSVLCPTVMEGHDNTEPDPVCGITFYDKSTGSDSTQVHFINGAADKLFTGALGVVVYIDCSSKKKLLQLAREYDSKYGERFNILLDGELVFVLLETSQFVDNSIGNNPRMAYFYRVEPQPYTVQRAIQISTLTFDVESLPASTLEE